jgi:sulfite exporter TauE/SafE
MRSSKFGGIYDDAASIGKTFAYLKGGLFIFIAVVLISFGVYQGSKPNVYSEKIQFIVKTVSKQFTGTINGIPKYDYNLTGNTKGCPYTLTVNSYPNYVQPGQVLEDIYMRPECNGSDAVRSPVNNSTIRNWLVIIGIVIIIFAVGNMFVVSKFKGVAAAQGAENIFGLFNRFTR